MRKLLIFPALVALLGALRAEAAQVQIQLRGSDDPNNDYLAWAPVPATIRVSDPTGLTGDLPVVLSNGAGAGQPCGGAGHGAVVFAANVGPGETATADALNLTLPKDGRPVPFVVAGKFRCPSIGAKDAAIQVRGADGASLGSRNVMVRIRKDVETLTTAERQIYLDALRAIKLRDSKDPHSFEGFVRTHRLSSLGARLPKTDPNAYPDQAHGGPAFLAWHRAYLLEFERELQKIDPRVALPYWRIWQPLPTMPKLFDSAFLGRNSIDVQNPAVPELTVFDDTNPLYGWTMPYSNTGQEADQTALYRYRSDWKQPGSRGVESPETLAGQLARPGYEAFARNTVDGIEQNPHNVGHNATGSWMQDCTISPSDPAFWLFHTEHDRLWAQWQNRHGRFDNTGADRDAYYIVPTQKPGDPNYGHFDPASGNCRVGGWSCPPLGHNLFDTMWPWDGITGSQPTDVYAKRRPSTAELGPFPRSTVPGLWPAADARPRPADVIDYAGVTDRKTDLGYGYDDVPFGAKPAAAVAALVAQAESAPMSGAALARVATRKDAAPAERQTAIQTLGASGDVALLQVSRSVIGQRDAAHPEPARAAVAAFGVLMLTHDELMAAHHHDIMAIAETALSHPDAETRSAAAQLLLGMDDKQVVQVLRAALAKPSAAGFSRVEAIEQLGMIGKHRYADLLRPYLRLPDAAVQLAAVQALAGDSGSVAARTALLDDTKAAPALRAAALDSLVPDNPALPDKAAGIAADKAADPALRRHALAALGAYVVSNRAQLSGTDLAALKAKVATLDAADLPKPVADNVKATIDAALAGK